MPNVYVTFPEIAQSVSRPVVYDIVSQVEEITKIDRNTKIYFPGESQKMQQPGTSLDNAGATAQSRDPNFENDNYLFIEVAEDFSKETLSATNTTGMYHHSLFTDDQLGVYLAPMYATCKVIISFKYRSKSKTEAMRWHDDIRMRVSQMRDVNIHSVTYHYPLPGVLVYLLKVIHETRENKFGYGEDFAQYIQRNSANRLTLVGDLAGKEAKFAIPETQARIVGLFEFDGIPDKPELDTSTGTHTVSFDYSFSYERPLACHAKYPIMVHNQLLPREFIEFVNRSKNFDDEPMHYSPSLKGLSFFEAEKQLPMRLDLHPQVTLPPYDDFVCENTYPGTASVLVALCELDETDFKTLLNLKELGDYQLDPTVLDFIQNSEYGFMLRPYLSLLNISVYKNNGLVHYSRLQIDNDLNVKFKEPADPRFCYRVRIALSADIGSVTIPAVKRLSARPKAFVKLIGAIDTMLRDNPGFAVLATRDKLPEPDVAKVFKFLTGYDMVGSQDIASLATYTTGPVGITTAPGGYGGQYPQQSFVAMSGLALERYRKERIRRNIVTVDEILTGLPGWYLQEDTNIIAEVNNGYRIS